MHFTTISHKVLDSRKICKNFVLIISNYWRLFIHLRNSQIVSNICLVRYASTITLKWFIELKQSHQNEFNLDRSHQHNVSKLTAVTVGSVMHSIHYYFWRTVSRNGTEVPQKCFQFSCLFSWGTKRRGLLVFSLLSSLHLNLNSTKATGSGYFINITRAQ